MHWNAHFRDYSRKSQAAVKGNKDNTTQVQRDQSLTHDLTTTSRALR